MTFAHDSRAMPEAIVTTDNGNLAHPIRINGDDPTFVLSTDRLRARTGVNIGPREQDLLEIAATVFAADGTISRGGATRPGMGASWRRDLCFTIPVLDPEHWSQPVVREALTDAVNFLTEDNARFEFTRKDLQDEAQPFLDLDPHGKLFNADRIIMFSGGLDSYAGALENLSQTNEKIVLVTHRSAQKAIPRQVELGLYLEQQFPGRLKHLHVLARRTGYEAKDSTQRSRSFLFAALGQAVARTFGAEKVSFFENGIISHNLPLGRQIVGTMATRTTHPNSVRLLNELIRLAFDNPVPIDNPFQWLTKTDVVTRIAANGGEQKIMRAVSCTSLRAQDSVRTHCGACSQCMDRRFAVIAAGLEDHEGSEIYETDVFVGRREQTLSRTMAVDWTRAMLRYAEMTPQTLMAEVGSELGRIARGHPNMRTGAVVARTLQMHQRQAGLVETVLTRMIERNAGALATGRLPSTSLLVMHSGQGMSGAVRKPHARDQFSPLEDAEIDDDLPLDPDAPLRVSFRGGPDERVVIVEGYCRLEGKLARMPFALLPALMKGRSADLDSADYDWTEAGVVADQLKTSKEGVRQNLSRLRRRISESYEQIHQTTPPDELLVQTRKAAGYRLDPDIDLLDTNI